MISFFSSFHISQCKKYRDQFTDQQKLIYEEKLEASELFKDKKALYPSRYYGFTLPIKINILKKFLKCICRHFLVGFDFSDTRIFNFMNYFEIGWICCSVANSLRPHGLLHTRLPCPSPSPRACSNSSPLSWWCHPTISSSVVPFSFHLQSFLASGSFPMSWLFAPGGQSVGTSALTSVLPVNIQVWFF